MRYKWADGSRVQGVKASDAGKALDQLRKKNGGMLTSEQVLAAATARNHVLHDAFEWDDKKAGHAYRLIQAGNIIRAVIRVPTEGTKEPPVRAYVRVVTESGAAYTGIEDAVKDVNLREQVLARAKSQLVTWKETYKNYQEFSALFPIIDEVAA